SSATTGEISCAPADPPLPGHPRWKTSTPTTPWWPVESTVRSLQAAPRGSGGRLEHHVQVPALAQAGGHQRRGGVTSGLSLPPLRDEPGSGDEDPVLPRWQGGHLEPTVART